VLIQLPKKEAGAGLAFGGAATDALFGAGSGNVLTKVTKYAATVFFVMAILLSFIQSQRHQGASSFEQKLNQQGSLPRPMPNPATAAPQSVPQGTPALPLATPPTGTGSVTVPQVEQAAPTTSTPAPAVTTNAAPNPAPVAPANPK
jgi:preprotein translocase subunit SecG